MLLDSFTVLVAGCAVLLLIGSMFIYFWAQDRAAAWLLWWGVPLMFGGAGLVFYMRPGWDADIGSIVVGNLARLLAIASLWQGVRVFHGRPPLWIALGALTAGWLALCVLPEFRASLPWRIAAVSVINGGLCALAAYELWRDRSEVLVSRMPAVVVFSSFASLMALRAALVTVLPFPVGALPLDPLWLGGFMLIVFIHTAFAGFLLISMTKERKEAEQRGFALSDPLTGLMNRRAFNDFAERASRRRKYGREPMALLVLDLDGFKSINDRFGHDVGDRMLVAFAHEAEASIRPADQLYRIGGEEFCCHLPDTEVAGAIVVAERIRAAFEAVRLIVDGQSVQGTVSVGVAATTHAGLDLLLLLAAADAALYEAKARGRNRVVVADPGLLIRPPTADGLPPRRLSA